MTDPHAKYWSDILTAIEAIESFVVGIDTLNAYVPTTKQGALWNVNWRSLAKRSGI